MTDFPPHVVPTERYGELGVVDTDAELWQHGITPKPALPSRLLVVWGRECETCKGSKEILHGGEIINGSIPCPKCDSPIPGLLLEPCPAKNQRTGQHDMPCEACVLPGIRSEWVAVGEWLDRAVRWARDPSDTNPGSEAAQIITAILDHLRRSLT